MTSAAGPAGVTQGAGASQQLLQQPAYPTPIFGTNHGASAPSTVDRPSANPVASHGQLGMLSAPQGAFPNWVPTAGLVLTPASQGPPFMTPNRIEPLQMAGTKPAIHSGVILQPTEPQQLAHAKVGIMYLKQVYSAKLPTMQLHELSDGQRTEYSRLLQQLHEVTQDPDVKLPMYWIVLRSDNMIRNLVAIVSLVAHQRASYSTRSNQVIIDPSGLKSMHSLLQSAIKRFRHQTMEAAAAPQQADSGLAGLIINRQSPPPTAPDVIPSTRPIPPILIPDLTGLITRCHQDPVSGGTYGNIYKCMYHGPDGDIQVAIKAMRPQMISTEVVVFVLRKELGIWKRLQHSNILKLMGTTRGFGSSVALVAPWIVNDTLTSFLNKYNGTLTLLDRLLLLRGVAAGLNYLHTFSFTVDGHTYSNPVVHGDLTGNNVLIGSDRTAYLTDFGLSGTLTKLPGMTYLVKMSCRPGALRWTAPELLSKEESASAITLRAICIPLLTTYFVQVLTGVIPWRHLRNDFVICSKVTAGEIQPRPDDACVTDGYWNFMTRCWSKTPVDRPSAKEALEFFESALDTIEPVL
ncbi:kinase-like domain-containing protein [Suillus paluster]|uniref:kinase-like domain-containing protein n=1 Tax=Suillus paluster TaxID=48578 RepID=UPI001B87F7DE|nr:kinase-like domain-containing protein [Suillus paluster]KAG1726249.1 kinase-like domain-containing protein [Suillus paluster]